MKKKLLKKMVAVLLAGTMVMGLAGCGGDDTQDTQGTQASVNTEAGQTEGSGGGTGETAEGGTISYPMDTDTELSYWCGQFIDLAEDVDSWQDSPFHSGLVDKTGVTIDWRWATVGSDVGQSYQLLWVDRELPNMVLYQISSNEARTLLDDGLIWDLTEYLPKYAPNYWAWLNDPENEAERREAMLDDGTFYSVASAKEGLYGQVYMGPIIRQDWLDECNLEMPVTLEDWENVLTAFKENYNANLSFFTAIMRATGGIASGTGAYGFANTADFRVDNDGNIVIPQIMPEYKEMMEVLARWWENGLIDMDALSNNADAVRQKALSGSAGIVFAEAGTCEQIINDAAAEGNGANWVGVSFPRTAPGDPTTMIGITATRLTGYHTVITTQTSEEDLITALRWLDYGWTKEGQMYWNFGEEGVSYTLDEEGHPQWTELVTGDPLGVGQGRRKYCGVTASASVLQLTAYGEANNSEVVDNIIKCWMDNTESNEHMLPKLELSDEDHDRYVELWSPISTYISEESLKMMIGETPVSNVDAFVDELYNLGLQEVLDIQQKYYDEFLLK